MKFLVLIFALAAVAVAAVAQQTGGITGTSPVPTCASKLVACGAYLNMTASSPPPPATCCDPLREAAANETACICSVLNNDALLKAFNVDPAQGMRLAKKCGVVADASVCSKAAAPAAATVTSPSSSSSTGGTATTGTKTSTNAGIKHRVSRVGISFLMSLIFIWLAVMA